MTQIIPMPGSESLDNSEHQPSSERPIPCPPPWRAGALQRLRAANDPGAVAELVAAVELASDQPEQLWDGLLIVAGNTGPSAAVWVQPQPGQTAQLWPPLSTSRAAANLVRAAVNWAAEQELQIVQAVIDTEDQETAALLRNNGLPRLADLLYLNVPVTAEMPQPAPAAGPPSLSFEAIGPLPSARLERLMSLIEDRSLDCPGLQGILSPSQAIEGFRRQGQFAPEHWCVLRYHGEDAGALLMTTHPQIESFELMYMGIVPRWRGHGLGARLIEEAMRRAGAAGAKLVLLSVDATNQPAIRLYEQAGFRLYGRRTLYAWTAQHTAAVDG